MVRNKNEDNDESTRRTYLSAAGSIVGTSALVSGTAVAGDDETTDRNPSDSDVIDTCRTIDESGAYELTADLAAEDDEACIVITADDVSLCGNGYSISGNGGGTGILVDGGDDVSVKNVAVENLDVGVEITGARRANLRTLTATDAPVEIDEGWASCVVRDSTLENCGIDAVAGLGQLLVLGNTITDAPLTGIFVEATFNATIIENTIAGSERAGIGLNDFGRGQIIRNEIVDNGGAGIDLRDATETALYLNEITGNAGAGIVLRQGSDDNDITDNTLSNNGGGPCDIGEDPSDNTFSGNEPPCEEA